jgi:hypothetical protein
VAQHVLPGILQRFAQRQPNVWIRVIDDSALASVVSSEGAGWHCTLRSPKSPSSSQVLLQLAGAGVN